jgi:hypothetical protein
MNGTGNVNSIHLMQNRYQWQGLVNTVVNFRVP